MRWRSPRLARAGKGLWGSDIAGSATALSQLCHCPVTATHLSPLCRCPMVIAVVGWLWALCHLSVPLLGSVVPRSLCVPRCPRWLCHSCSPLAVPCVHLCSPQSQHRAPAGCGSSWTAGMEAGAAEGPLQVQVSECPLCGTVPPQPPPELRQRLPNTFSFSVTGQKFPEKLWLLRF